MKRQFFVLTLFAFVLLLAIAGSIQAQEGGANPATEAAAGPEAVTAAVDTSFTYQGSLLNNGAPVNDTCDFTFTLWDAATDGKSIGTNTRTGVVVEDGLFTVTLDFAAIAFKGNARWLEIGVDCDGGGTVTLSPRQPLTATPYSLGLRPGATIDADQTDPALTLSNAIGSGLNVSSTGDDGVHVGSAGSPSTTNSSSYHNGIEVEGAEGHGLYVGRADRDGVHVDSADYGVVVSSAGADGVYVNSAGDEGVFVHSAGSPSTTNSSSDHNGFEVQGAQGHGLYVGRADLDGVYVDSAGEDGVVVNTVGSPSTTNSNSFHNGIEIQGAQGHGLYVGRADRAGLVVHSAGGSGVYVDSADDAGLYVGSAGEDGVVVQEAGSPSTTYSNPNDNGIEVRGAGGHGLYVGQADRTGVVVNNAGEDGMYVGQADRAGVVVNYAGEDGMYVHSAGSPSETISSSDYNGIEVQGAEGNGLYVGRADESGVAVIQAGVDGVYVGMTDEDGVHVWSADGDGVYAGTTMDNHEWGFNTPDKIYAGSGVANSGPLLFVAQNGGESGLETGDVVAVSGMGAAFGESNTPTPLVQRADAASSAPVFGVVYGRFALTEEVEEVERDGRIEQGTSSHANSIEGAIAPGEYLQVVVMGAAQVKVESISSDLPPGALLAVDGDGHTMMADATTTPFGAIVGTAMQAPDTAKDGLIWVLVNPR